MLLGTLALEKTVPAEHSGTGFGESHLVTASTVLFPEVGLC